MIVAAYGAVRSDYDELFIFGPSQPLDRAFIPLRVSTMLLHIVLDTLTYVYAPNQPASAAVYIDARFRGLGTPVCIYLVLIAVYSYGRQHLAVDHGGLKRTYSAAVRSPYYVVVLELEILVEDGCVELDFTVEFVANFLPVVRGLGHGEGQSWMWT